MYEDEETDEETFDVEAEFIDRGDVEAEQDKGESQELIEGCVLSAVGLTIREDVTFDQWIAAGKLLRLYEQSIQFALGDWLNFGDAVYGEKYAQALVDTDYSKGRLETFAYLARKIFPENRVIGLSFSHHEVVAKFEPYQQRAFLHYAKAQYDETNGSYSIAEFRQYIKAYLKKLENKTGGEMDSDEEIDEKLNIPKGERYHNALISIRNLLSEKDMTAIPSRGDVAWMITVIKKSKAECIKVIGE